MELIKVYQQTTGWSDALMIIGSLTFIGGIAWLITLLKDGYLDNKITIVPAIVLLISICTIIGSNYMPERTLETYQVTDQKQYLQMLNNGYHEYSSDELTVTVYRDVE